MDIFNHIKKLGFGLMRLPISGGILDSNEFTAMVKTFIEAGFSYFDTAPGYMNGLSESFFKQYVSNIYPRHYYQLASKMPAWDKTRIKNQNDVSVIFNNSLKNTGVDYFDYYLLHNIGEKRTEVFEKYHVWEFVQECKKQGRILYYGISFHSKAEELDSLLHDHPDIDFVQLQINYADWNDQIVDAKRCYEIATAYSKPIVVMEPLKGGILFSLPNRLLQLLNIVNNQSPASWAFRWLKSLPQINLVLSGMSSLEQLKENVKLFETLSPLNKKEIAVIEQIQNIIDTETMIPCSGCQYCLSVCPRLIPINQVLSALNIDSFFNNRNAALNKYRFQTRDGNLASTCVQCKVCEQICPQHLPISQLLKTAANIFE
ncbi:MAG: aldo/keto reductase [Bacteroidales bacterium]|nr:aldo/keto reductase [Bacteroidales bacterium]